MSNKLSSLVLSISWGWFSLEKIMNIMTNITNTKMTTQCSPFLSTPIVTEVNSLAILHLRRDLQQPVILRDSDDNDDGYSEGKVENTRFGSFPHTTLIGQPWGSQILASKVDTGSRGRRPAQDKRKRDPESSETVIKRQKTDIDSKDTTTEPETGTDVKVNAKPVLTAQSGFIHIVPPTPESWTSSLPHRTQVVYTPDYSYILHRLRARPGSRLIEAGAGSGSFTHASARAVFSGYKTGHSDEEERGRVWSYEFHQKRHEKLVEEIKEHGLNDVVTITHRDVCEKGFLIYEPDLQIEETESPNTEAAATTAKSPRANAIFLDLPAPWLALPHLTRQPTEVNKSESFVSPLDPNSTVYLCTFSPCIEQVQRTVTCMRQLGWVDISTVEVSNRRYDIRREHVGLERGAQRGVQNSAADVDEAVRRLADVEGAIREYHELDKEMPDVSKKSEKDYLQTRCQIIQNLVESKMYKEGRLVHRLEPEIKTHTSYLTFALLPREWSEEEEQKMREKWPIKIRHANDKGRIIGLSRRQIRQAEQQAQAGPEKPLSKKQQKRAERQARKQADEISKAVDEPVTLHDISGSISQDA